jgi:DNA-binding response OmpR family regulator
MVQKTILVVEDEQNLREVIALFLRGDGFCVLEASSGEEALPLFSENTVDLIILDVMLPGINGFDVCTAVRKSSEVPVLFLTALGDDDYYRLGYQVGGDDYIVKPFKASILALKVRRILERQARVESSRSSLGQEIHLDENAFRCFIDGADVNLTQKEFQLLRILINNEGRVMTRDSLLNIVWGYEYIGDTRVVDNHIKNIRKTLGKYASYINTVISIGYKYEKSL